MEKERGVILDEISATKTNPKKPYRMILRNYLFKGHPHR
jgi:predicted Zn-dependent peptidase